MALEEISVRVTTSAVLIRIASRAVDSKEQIMGSADHQEKQTNGGGRDEAR
jgi:hypothetical protein